MVKPLPTPNPSRVGSERPSRAWSQEEDIQLVHLRAQGMKWAPIAQNHFPKKTPNACRKRHERLMKNQNQGKWNAGVRFDGVRPDVLAQTYSEVRENILASKVGEKWQEVENKVYTETRNPRTHKLTAS